MAALNTCLLTNPLHKTQQAKLRALAEYYAGRGNKQPEITAAEAMLKEALSERADIAKQIEAANGVVPELAPEFELTAEKDGVKPAEQPRQLRPDEKPENFQLTPQTMTEAQADDAAKREVTAAQTSMFGASGQPTQQTAAPPSGMDALTSMSDDALASMIDDVAAETGAPRTEKPTGERAPTRTTRAGQRTIAKVKAPAEKAAASPQAAERTTSEIAKSLGVNLSSAGTNALDGLVKLFGSSGKLSSGLTFDEETYAKAKPHFQAMYRDFKAAGKDVRDFIRAILDAFGTAAKPYILRFAQDMRQEVSDVPVPDTDLERDRQDTEGATPAVEAAVPAGPGGPDGGAGRPGARPGEKGGGRESGEGVPAGGAAVAGERPDQPLSGPEPKAGSSGEPAGTDVDPRGGGFGDAGVPVESVSTEAAERTSERVLQLEERLKRQRLANKLPVKGGIANIRETLPLLLPGQQEDVQKAEARFAKTDGYGFLLANGTGTGKTASALGTIKRFDSRGKSNILIVAPSDKIIADWIAFAQNLGLTLNKLEDTKSAGKGIVITTYANMGANNALATRDWDLVVADEAHYLMQEKSGKETGYIATLRGITRHPDHAFQRHQMLSADDLARQKEINEEMKRLLAVAASSSTSEADETKAGDDLDRLEKELQALRAKLKEALAAVEADVAAKQGDQRARALFLSATPFAYEKAVDWANGYLFDYKQGYPHNETSLRYNTPNPREYFFVTHFGYRMRTNKLTEPDEKVDRPLMQRQFNGWLKKNGALSGRMLEVEPDYDRKFILVESAIGQRIDDALTWVTEQAREFGVQQAAAKVKAPNGFWALRDVLDKRFDYLSRRYLLEAIKAEESVKYVKEHLAKGRKVVVFHDYKKGGGFNPFDIKPMGFSGDTSEDAAGAAGAEAVGAFNAALAEFTAQFKDLIAQPFSTMASPINVFQREFPGALLFNGDVPPKQRRANVERFQDDASGPQVILVQSAAGKEGISLHDTTGKNQRVLFNLGQPTQPTTAIQQEGRIYRTGQVTDAIFRYFNTGTNWEKWAFATTIAHRASTAENLAVGEQARALKDAFILGFEESGDYRAGDPDEGKGGKARDKAANDAISEYDRAKTYYFGQQKKDSRTKAQEGKDYFATPEPLGVKMVEWADARTGEDMLEPSGGHGAIARWMPELANRVAIEPSMQLRARLAMSFDGKIIDSTFEDHNTVNKYDAVAMNPPFGTGGKTAIEHVEKAAKHLRAGGRIVALIPTGPAADKRFDAWFYGEETKPAKPLVDHPKLGKIYRGDTITFDAFGKSETMVVYAVDQPSGMSALYARPKGANLSGAINLIAARSIEPTGTRTETYRPADGLQLVADIKLPPVTFERAGTQVATRIVVIEKTDAPVQAVQRDLSGTESIADLFDQLEHLTLPERAKKAPAEPEARKAEVTPEKQIERGEAEVIEHTTQKGKVIRGIVRTDLTREQAKEIDEFTFKKDGGWFIREKHLKGPDLKASAYAGPHVASTGTTAQQMRDRAVTEFGKQTVDALEREILTIVDSAIQLPRHIRAWMAKFEFENKTTVRAIHDGKNGKVYIIADRLTTQDVRRLFIHEIGEHHGLKKLIGAKRYAQLQQRIVTLHQLGNKEVVAAWNHVLKHYGNLKPGSETFITEVIAKVSESAYARSMSWWQELVQWIKEALFKMGVTAQLNDEDIRQMVLASLHAVAQGEIAASSYGEAMAAAGDPNDPSISAAAGGPMSPLPPTVQAPARGPTGPQIPLGGVQAPPAAPPRGPTGRQQPIVRNPGRGPATVAQRARNMASDLNRGIFGGLTHKFVQVVRDIDTPSFRTIADLAQSAEQHEKRTRPQIGDFIHLRYEARGRFDVALLDILRPLASNGHLLQPRRWARVFPWGYHGMLPESTNDALWAALTTSVPPADPKLAAVYTELRALQDRLLRYQRTAGLDVGEVKNYFPRIYKRDVIASDPSAFQAVLVAHGIGQNEAADITQKIIDNDGLMDNAVNRSNRVHAHNWQERVGGAEGGAVKSSFQKRRSLDIPDAALAKFLETDVAAVMDRYINLATRRAEYTRAFGKDESRLNDLVMKGLQELAQKPQRGISAKEAIDTVYDFADALQGVYRPIHNQTLNQLNNLAVNAEVMMHLAYSAMASIPEFFTPSLTGEVSAVSHMKGGVEAIKTAAVGVANVVTEFVTGKNPGLVTEMRREAELFGAISDQAIRDAYDGTFGAPLQRMTDKFMELTMLAQLTRAQKTMAFSAFMAEQRRIAGKLARGNQSPALLDLLKDYRISEADLRAWGGSGVPAPALDLAMKRAAQRFTMRVITTPSEVSRPYLTQRPALRLVFLFQGFATVFANTLIKRAAQNWARNAKHAAKGDVEAMRKLVAPAVTASLMAATAIFMQMIREALRQDDDEEPPPWAMVNKELGEKIVTGIDRSGFLTPMGSRVYQWISPYKTYSESAAQKIGAQFGPAVGDFTRGVDLFRGDNAEKQAAYLITRIPFVNLLPESWARKSIREGLVEGMEAVNEFTEE